MRQGGRSLKAMPELKNLVYCRYGNHRVDVSEFDKKPSGQLKMYCKTCCRFLSEEARFDAMGQKPTCGNCGSNLKRVKDSSGVYYECFRGPYCAAEGDLETKVPMVLHFCPCCQKKTRVQLGKSGKFLTCSAYPDCGFTATLDSLSGGLSPRQRKAKELDREKRANNGKAKARPKAPDTPPWIGTPTEPSAG